MNNLSEKGLEKGRSTRQKLSGLIKNSQNLGFKASFWDALSKLNIHARKMQQDGHIFEQNKQKETKT